ncbi:Uncharacterised protein r2_g4002 [Pycnogonum litorale]
MLKRGGFLSRIIIGEENWAHHYELDIQRVVNGVASSSITKNTEVQDNSLNWKGHEMHFPFGLVVGLSAPRTKTHGFDSRRNYFVFSDKDVKTEVPPKPVTNPCGLVSRLETQ